MFPSTRSAWSRARSRKSSTSAQAKSTPLVANCSGGRSRRGTPMPKRKAKPKSRKPKKASPAKHAPSADEQALLAAVIAHPDEDTPRLMYADWLDEHGQPARPEFIRPQIEATRCPPGDSKAKALRARVVELVKQHRKEWTDGITGGVFVRGFLTAARFSNLKEFCRKAAKLCAQDPISRRLRQRVI